MQGVGGSNPLVPTIYVMIVIYTTYPNKDEARKVSEALIDARLVACANILAGHESLYRWDGAVQNETEVAVIYKTRDELFPEVEKIIKSLHSYDVPCVVAWEASLGHEPFLQWVHEETGAP